MTSKRVVVRGRDLEEAEDESTVAESRHSEGEAEKFSGAALVSGDVIPPVPVGVGVQAGGQGRNVLPAGNGPPRCQLCWEMSPSSRRNSISLSNRPLSWWRRGTMKKFQRINESP